MTSPFAFSLFSSRRGRRWLTLPAAWAFLVLLLLNATPAQAYFPISESQPTESTCNDRDELAGVLMVEGGAQPTTDIIRMGQILQAEAESRGLTICALTRVTNFTTARHFVEAHPESYAAHRFAAPPEWMLDLASEVLLGRYPDVRAGAMHFDGDGMRIIFKP